jgi:hypothetical protein
MNEQIRKKTKYSKSRLESYRHHFIGAVSGGNGEGYKGTHYHVLSTVLGKEQATEAQPAQVTQVGTTVNLFLQTIILRKVLKTWYFIFSLMHTLHSYMNMILPQESVLVFIG